MSPTDNGIVRGSGMASRVAGAVSTIGADVGIVDRLGRIPTRRLLGYLSAAVLAVPLMGLVFLTDHFGTIFNIDGETEFAWPPWQTRIVFPALISSALLLCAGWCWLEISHRASVGWQRLATGSFGALLVFMTADEFFGIHEWVNQFGIRWQILYGPVAMAVGVLVTAFLSVVARRGLRAPMTLTLLGAASWFVAQVLEFVEYDGRPPAPGQPEVRASLYWVYVFLEESLENVGSVLFLLAALSLAASLTAGRRRSADAISPAEPTLEPTGSRGRLARRSMTRGVPRTHVVPQPGPSTDLSTPTGALPGERARHDDAVLREGQSLSSPKDTSSRRTASPDPAPKV